MFFANIGSSVATEESNMMGNKSFDRPLRFPKACPLNWPRRIPRDRKSRELSVDRSIQTDTHSSATMKRLLAFRTFPLPVKGFSSLSGHLGKGRKVPCLPQFHFAPCLSRKRFESRERYYWGNFRRKCSRSRKASRECLTLKTFVGWRLEIRWLDRSEKQWQENLGGAEEYHPTAYRPFNFSP
jgi:hypothetical protein